MKARPVPRWKRRNWTVARMAAVLAAAVAERGKHAPDLQQIERRFGLKIRELLHLTRLLGAQEDLGVTAPTSLALDLDFGSDGKGLSLRSQGAESLRWLTRLSLADARLASRALRSLAATPADQVFCQGLGERLKRAVGEDWDDEEVFYFRPTDPEPVRRKVSLLRQAMESLKAVAFSYHGPSANSSQRLVHPLSLRRDEGVWRLLAWDPSRQAQRVFVLDHMKALEATDTAFAWPQGLSEQQIKSRDLSVYMPTGKEIKVTLAVTRQLYQDFKSYFIGPAKRDKRPDWVRVTLKTASPKWLIRTFLPRVGEVEVLGPTAISVAWRSYISTILDRK